MIEKHSENDELLLQAKAGGSPPQSLGLRGPSGRPVLRLGTDSQLFFSHWQLVKSGAMMNQFSGGELCISSHFVSEKQPGSQKLLWNGLIVSVFVLTGRGWLWTCMIGKKHNQLFRNVYPGKLHKRVFCPLWPPFWIVSVVELQVEAAPGKTGTPPLASSFPPLASSFLHSRQPLHAWYWIPPIGTSENNSCRGGREQEQTLGYCREFSLLGWEISHFLVVTEQTESWVTFYNLCNWFYVLLKVYQISDSYESFPPLKGEGTGFPSAQLSF